MPASKITRPAAVVVVTAGATLLAGTGLASAETDVAAPPSFTSAFTVNATPDAVVDADGAPAPGQPGSGGVFTFRLNSQLDIICYDITLTGVSGDYQSPAKTATHIHQSVAGVSGPPRIAFPNPAPIGEGPRTSSGCLQGPFTTGVVRDGMDTGAGFTVAEIEADPAAFAADAHTVDFTAGVVRGQLSPIPPAMG